MGSPEVVALMLADGRLPTGGHTQSAGLEPAVRAGLGAGGDRLTDVAGYARDRLRTITRVEAAVAVVARHITVSAATAPRRGSRPDKWPATGDPRLSPADDATGTASRAAMSLGMVEAAWAARTPSQVMRGAARRQGRAYLRLAARVWPDVLRYLRNDTEVARPVVVGVIAGVTGLSAEQVARSVAHDDVQTVVSASLKLLPVDPADAASWLAGLHDDIERLVTDVASLTEIDKLPASGAPLLDVFAQNHADERMRLFHA
ncbi:urease accessory protein UreF [Kribbella turkmenica]|uniref:Urease accessory protein UreF n=1 Tax=Kribbella turkmenica TaxID=2530375 RepID=A0A4R4WV43_9ACTN|nr:urease accessory UreF family protein [Kribbella turkmenica]TDD21556.1 urease accessory protein UreF [Kribbella turkmenica]